MNFENIRNSKELSNIVNPFFAFRRQLANGINLETKEFEGIERNYLAVELVKQALSKGKTIKIVDEAIIYR